MVPPCVRNWLGWRYNRETDCTLRSDHFEHYIVIRPAPNPKIGFRILKPQAPDRYFIEKGWKFWIAQANFHSFVIEFETKRASEQRKGNGTRPGLRRTRNGIKSGPVLPLPLKPTKKLR